MQKCEALRFGRMVENGLEGSGLSQRAMRAVRRVGSFVQRHPQIPLIIGAVGYVSEVVVNQTLHPEWGLGANVFSPIFFDISPVDGENSLNALQGTFQGMFVAGGATGVASGLAEKARQLISLPDIKRGRAPNPYKQMVVMVDQTNEAREGSTHGDFYNEFYRHLLSQPEEIVLEFIKKYGPVCEIVPDNVPEPLGEPTVAYFRTTSSSNTEFLRDIVRADRSKGTITALMSRSHTVWDEDFQPQQRAIDAVNNMNLTITDTLNAGDIQRVIVINDRDITTHGAYDPTSGTTRPETHNASEYFSIRGFQVVAAEREVMDDLVNTFQRGAYKRIVLMDDGTPEGERIAANWLNDYNRLVAKAESGSPEIVEVPEGKLGEVLKEREYDSIFLIGADDIRVAEAAQAILEQQADERESAEGYKVVPLEILFEGRGSIDKLEDLNGGNLHFVHEILARRVLELLLRRNN